MIVTNDPDLAQRCKHLSTTAKVPHAYEFVHDEIGYNLRLPNLNAALGCAQMECLPEMLAIKGEIAEAYRVFCDTHGLRFVNAPSGTDPNFWLNAVLLDTPTQRDTFIEHTNSCGVMTRPIWRLMNTLDMFKDCQRDDLENSYYLEQRIVNLPSSVPETHFERLRT